jgi:NosR/NirI family transcriptional regulator, nitrous oxide reductase regulator
MMNICASATLRLIKMNRLLTILLVLTLLLSGLAVSGQQQRFPKPEFESGYTQPEPITPAPRSNAMEYIDTLVLLAALSLLSWLAIKKRSRQGILWISIFTLLYFGFYRDGCICPVGSLQDVVLALTHQGYTIPITVLLFFLLPLAFSIFFGRVFCAGACPLGAIQDLVIIKNVPLPFWLRKTLGIIPYVYLALAVMFAATGTDFIICRYDPFVGIFRMDAPWLMIILGISFLLMGLFIGRPYCRFLCPYGVLLRWTSGVSRWHLSITPSQCIRCKLCTTSCPFDAIDYPTDPKVIKGSREGARRFLLYAVLIPVWILAGAFTGYKAHLWLSKANPDVYLAELLISHPEIKNDPDNIDVQTFLSSGKTMDTLVKESLLIQKKFLWGSTAMGAFIGLVIGMMLLNLVTFRRNTDYKPDRGDCFSCGRCLDYCPVKKTDPIKSTGQDE